MPKSTILGLISTTRLVSCHAYQKRVYITFFGGLSFHTSSMLYKSSAPQLSRPPSSPPMWFLFNSFSMSSVNGVGDFFLLFLLRFTSCTDTWYSQAPRSIMAWSSCQFHNHAPYMHLMCSAHCTLLIWPVMLIPQQWVVRSALQHVTPCT